MSALAFFADGVLEGALAGAIKGAIVGGIIGVGLWGVLALHKKFSKKKDDDQSKP